MPPKKFAVNLVDISFARAAPTAWYGANTSQICARSNDWRARGDLNARPLVPEFSENWLSCWFALLSAPACYPVFPAVRPLLFRNCSEIFAIDSSGCKVFIRDG